jgi:CRP/FNR family cyclic AMP-dependent transcriptional regulator
VKEYQHRESLSRRPCEISRPMNQNVVLCDHWPASSLLGELGPVTRTAMLTLGRSVRFTDGARLLHEGDVGTHLYLLLAGWFKVVTVDADGHEALIAIRVGGDVVGELTVFDGRPRTATVKAAGPGAARRIEKQEFLAFLTANGDALEAVMNAMARKLRWATQRRSEFPTFPVGIRVARVLAEMAQMYGQAGDLGVTIGAPVTQPDLAALVGASVPSVQRVLRSLREIGMIETHYRRILVRDVARLQRAAGTKE